MRDGVVARFGGWYAMALSLNLRERVLAERFAVSLGTVNAGWHCPGLTALPQEAWLVLPGAPRLAAAGPAWR